MNRSSLVSLILLFNAVYASTSSVISIDSITEAESIIKEHCQNALVLIDIDDTLLLGVDKIMRNANFALHEQFMAVLKEQPSWVTLRDTVYTTAQFQLVEEAFVPLIYELKKNNLVFGFTARPTGDFITGVSVERWTASVLEKLGVTFTPWVSPLDCFQYNILFTSFQPKELVLQQFLPEVHQQIDTIIMFDDRRDHVENVAEAIGEWNKKYHTNISFLGFHYKAVQYIDHGVDIHITNKQLDYLIVQGIYFSETEIRSLPDLSKTCHV